MSWNRLNFDPCAYNKRLDESTSVLTYNLDPNKFYNCNDCRIEFGVVGGNNVSLTTANLVDLESDLRNQTRLLSLCPEKKYLPNCKPGHQGTDGLPCGSLSSRNENLSHLRSCNLVQYKPRINHVGYKLDYPGCPVQSGGGKRHGRKKHSRFVAKKWQGQQGVFQTPLGFPTTY